ncbi:MAG: hypothetical protein H0W79_12980 [Rubrobacteraceae bacterium]|nr:hypothetical protein [Rubrobacteraceae bacterium]
MSFILTAIGLLLLVVALAGIALGIYVAVEPKTRASGNLFAIWWVPGVAAASGVLMRDVVTFAVGVVCFLVAGAVIVLEDRRPRKVHVREKSDLARGPGGNSHLDSERTTKKNRTKDSDRAAS